MLKIILSGCSGKMGGVITDLVENDPNAQIVAGVDPFFKEGLKYPVFPNFNDLPKADVIIDFSNPAALDNILEYSIKNNLAFVAATTG